MEINIERKKREREINTQGKKERYRRRNIERRLYIQKEIKGNERHRKKERKTEGNAERKEGKIKTGRKEEIQRERKTGRKKEGNAERKRKEREKNCRKNKKKNDM